MQRCRRAPTESMRPALPIRGQPGRYPSSRAVPFEVRASQEVGRQGSSGGWLGLLGRARRVPRQAHAKESYTLQEHQPRRLCIKLARSTHTPAHPLKPYHLPPLLPCLNPHLQACSHPGLRLLSAEHCLAHSCARRGRQADAGYLRTPPGNARALCGDGFPFPSQAAPPTAQPGVAAKCTPCLSRSRMRARTPARTHSRNRQPRTHKHTHLRLVGFLIRELGVQQLVQVPGLNLRQQHWPEHLSALVCVGSKTGAAPVAATGSVGKHWAACGSSG